MVDSLKIPDEFARVAIEGQQCVRIKIIAGAVGAVEVRHCRAGRGIHNSAILINYHAGPIVGGAGVFPRVLRPGFVPRSPGCGIVWKAQRSLPL